ncbi:MAG TPA: response regulator [Haliangium sp.]|nr:response regulator [Haliangium sp.]
MQTCDPESKSNIEARGTEPLATDTPAQENAPGQPATARATVLVVEDDVDMHRFVAKSLGAQYQVISAFDGNEGLAQALAHRPSMIVCDVMMPVMTGVEMIAEMRKRPELADTPILVLSAKADEEATVALIEEGAQDFITKPFSARELLVRVRNLLRVRQSQMRERQETAVNEALHRVAASFASELDQQKLLQLVTDEVTALTGAQFGSFFFNATREDGGAYLLYTLSGAPPEAFAGFPMPRATPLFGPTYRGEGVIRLDDVRQDPRYGKMGKQPAGHLPVVSYLAVPVVGKGGEVLGGLFFGHGEPGRFTEVHERIARGLAAHAAAALEKARLYEALRVSEVRAREADQRKDEFLAMLGHELRNPLAPIMTALQLMVLRGETSTRKEQQVIERQVRHLARLVDDLLDIARVTRGKIQIHKQRIHLASVVERAVEVASPLFEHRAHNLQIAVPRSGLVVDADPERLAQVIANLLTNAAKYTDPGGSIALTAEARDGRVIVAVKDNGQGIAPELLPRIFDLFVQGQRTSERAQGGLGIGLALVRNLVELHGGRVEARSDGPGRGSEFVFELPAAQEAPLAPPAPDSALASQRPRLASRVLVVDDNADAATSLADVLSILGHEVQIAHDGPQALAAAESFHATTALLDIGLPVMDGYELVRLLRERWADRPVQYVAITGYGQESDKERARAAGFDAHLVKPVALAELAALLQRRDTGAT